MSVIELNTPISREEIRALRAGDMVSISGWIYAGRDAVLPRIVSMLEDGSLADSGIELEGSVVFHTAVSIAGVGPTSSNKLEIESSIPALSQGGVRIHLGKGALSGETVNEMSRYDATFAIIAPVSALLADRTLERRCVAFPELGMEALYVLRVRDYPAIIGAANGDSL